MERLLRLLIPVLLVGTAAAGTPSPHSQLDTPRRPLDQLSIGELERRLEDIDQQLTWFAKPNMRTGVGTIGYRSIASEDNVNTEWIQIDLGEDLLIDQIVLVPTIYRDTRVGYRADGFPLEFRLIVGKSDDPKGVTIAAYGEHDHLLPRVAPVVVPAAGTTASWVRLEATTLSPRAWDGKYLLQLSEILVFSGQENVALRQSVEVSSFDPHDYGIRDARFLVDGFVPYLMDAYEGGQSLAFVSQPSIGESPSITIDLESVYPLNRIHLHTIDLSDNVPQSHPNDFGVPRRLLVEGATQVDFSDAVPLMEYQMETIFDAGPIIMRRFTETPCRYVRLLVIEPYLAIDGDTSTSVIGFAEIELFSGGLNVAVGRPTHANFKPNDPGRLFSALTDGKNLYGRILPIKNWLLQLARRHDLETLRPLVAAELNLRYHRQGANIRWLILLAALLGLAAIGSIVIEWIVRRRAITRTRQRIAADIHDELGANLHAIGLLGDLAQATADSPEKLNGILQRIRSLTERSGAAARDCVNLLESEGLFGDLVEDMRRSSARMMADLDHEISFEGEEVLRQLRPRIRIDLFLFYKECLANILRHSGATQATTRLVAEGNSVVLTVADNGHGGQSTDAGETANNEIPKSLRRRARLLGARVSVDHPASGGTTISLELKARNLGKLLHRTNHEANHSHRVG